MFVAINLCKLNLNLKARMKVSLAKEKWYGLQVDSFLSRE